MSWLQLNVPPGGSGLARTMQSAKTEKSRDPFREPGLVAFQKERDVYLIRYVRESPTFSLITVIPCFLVKEPPALMMARVV